MRNGRQNSQEIGDPHLGKNTLNAGRTGAIGQGGGYEPPRAEPLDNRIYIHISLRCNIRWYRNGTKYLDGVGRNYYLLVNP